MPEKIEVTLQVLNQVQAQELRDAWEEIVTSRKLTHAQAIDHGTEAIMERARTALEIIETAIREHPTTGQAGRLVRFLVGVYNGSDLATATSCSTRRSTISSINTAANHRRRNDERDDAT